MNIIKASVKLLDPINEEEVYKKLERVARTCYKSEDKITEDSAKQMILNLIKNGHESILEHVSISMLFVCDRGVSHELVRHRIASYAQESTRYCNYAKDKFGKELTFIMPCFWNEQGEDYAKVVVWKNAMKMAELCYMHLIDMGCSPEQARTVLPNSLKTEVVATMNIRQWRHFFRQRFLGVTGKPHPQMFEIAKLAFQELYKALPLCFEDIRQEAINKGFL